MFKKLVANLPFNPSLITQVGFYADRLRQEKSIRRLSFVFIALAMVVQMVAIISPPERSLATSTNHIQDGIRTKQDILNGYDFYASDLKDIYTRMNISRADLAALPNTPNVTIRSNDGGDWWTTGRTSLWNFAKVNDVYKKTEVPIVYRGQNTPSTTDDSKIFARQLRAWDIVNPYNTYKAFQGKSSATGQDFWIFIDCGNISWKGNWKDPVPPPEKPTPPPAVPEPKKPELEIKKSITTNAASVKPGDTFTYRIQYRNKVIGSVAEGVVIQDTLDIKNFDVVSPKNLNISGSGVLRYPVDLLPGSNSLTNLDITVRLKDPLPNGDQVCNADARIEAKNASAVSINKKVCIDVINPCKYDPSVPNVNSPNCVEPAVVCKVVDSEVDLTLRKVTYKTIVTSSNPATTQVKKYDYDFGDGATQSIASSEFTNTTMHTYAPGEFEANVVVYFRTTGQEQSTDKQTSCSQSINFEEDKPFSQAKTVKNLTKGLEGEEALNSSVGGGDVLEYTLITGNTQNYARDGVEVTDYIGDILDYATLDTEALEAEGGKFDKEQSKVYWENITIPANSQVELKFKVQMLNPIPSTNKPSSTSGDFDCRIENTYGNIVSLSVQCPVVKGIETIPNTGPGTSLFAGTAITAIIGYFFARSRLLSKELNIIRTDYATSGGM